MPRPVTNIYIKRSGPGQSAQDEKLANLPRRGQVLMFISSRWGGGGAHMMENSKFAVPGTITIVDFKSFGRGRGTRDEELANQPCRDQLLMCMLSRGDG